MRRTAAWLVPQPLRGSGGHRTIFQNVAALAAAGYDCHVYLETAAPGSELAYADAASGRRVVEQLFGPVAATFHLGFELDRDVDIAFATAWFTAEPLRRQTRARRRAYFVQDYEAAFFPMGDTYLEAEGTFRYGFRGTSIGRWLVHRLGRDFGMAVEPFDFCADRAVYRPLEGMHRDLSVCFVYQPEKPRRCTRLGAEALAIVKAEMPEVRIVFYGNDRRPRVPYEVEHLGLLSVEGCSSLYNRSAVGLCISTTNPSRVPFEMMAAGLPVVDVHRENNLFDHSDEATLLAEPTPESLAHAILGLLRDADEREARSRAGLEFMADRDLPQGFAQFVAAVDRLFDEGPPTEPRPVEPSYRRGPVIAPDALATRYRSHAEAAARAWPSHGEDRATSSWLFRKGSLPARARKRLRRIVRALRD